MGTSNLFGSAVYVRRGVSENGGPASSATMTVPDAAHAGQAIFMLNRCCVVTDKACLVDGGVSRRPASRGTLAAAAHVRMFGLSPD